MSGLKQGQVTLFVIIGLVALILIGFMFAIRSSFEQSVGDTGKIDYIGFDLAEGTLKSTVSDCISQVARESIYHVGLRAGYLDALPNAAYGENGAADYRFFDNVNIPVISDASGSILLPLDEIGKRICRKVYIDMAGCVDLEFFNESGYDVYSSQWSNDFALADERCEASIRQGSVAIKVTHPVALKRGDFSVNVSEFIAAVPINLGEAYEYAKTVANDAPNTASYNLSCNQAPQMFNVYVKDDGRVVQMMDYTSSQLVNGVMPTSFVFQFAVNDFSLQGECIR